MKYVHGDIKLSNLLLDGKNNLRIADFGTALGQFQFLSVTVLNRKLSKLFTSKLAASQTELVRNQEEVEDAQGGNEQQNDDGRLPNEVFKVRTDKLSGSGVYAPAEQVKIKVKRNCCESNKYITFNVPLF